MHNTLLLNQTIYITTGHTLQSTVCTTMMTIVEDTVGVHDLIAGSCSEQTNAVRYGVRGTPNCRRNFELALEPYGIPMREIPYSFNIFMNVPVTDEKTQIIEPVSGAGRPDRPAGRGRPAGRDLELPAAAQPLQRVRADRAEDAGLRAGPSAASVRSSASAEAASATAL